MTGSKSLYRSELTDTVRLKQLLNRIKSKHLIFEKDGDRYDSRTVAALAIDETAVSDNFIFTPGGAAVKAFAVKQSLLYTAKTGGTAGNSITVAYTSGATAGSEVVSVLSSAISVQIATGVSTAAQIKAAIEGSAGAAALVDVAVFTAQGGAGSDTQVTQTATTLAQGAAAPAEQKYDLADIQNVRRLRSRKWAIKFKSSANPA